MRNIDLFKDYENARLIGVDEFRRANEGRTYYFDELGDHEVQGIPISITRGEDGRLQVTFIPDTHLLAIGATRSGKTTGYVIPTINVLLKKKNKPSLVISDPKGELYRCTAGKFEKEGYRVLLLDFTEYTHSDCWNPLTKYYRLYQDYLNIHKEIVDLSADGRFKAELKGKTYTDVRELESAVREEKENCFDKVEKGIASLASLIVPITSNDPYWDTSARDLVSAVLYAMLEDSATGKVTEGTFSLDTMLKILDSFSGDSRQTYDKGYFTNRPATSKAYSLADKCILQQATNTRHCITSTCMSKVNKFRDTAVRRITCTNTFEMSELDDSPTVIYVSYKDEESLHYDVISMFLSNLYTELISIARAKGSKLDRPFYFLLDEFGNLPKFNDFDKVISACGGRNIWFLLILQSYAQLENIYGAATANIIKDNLNTHVFFGTNNPETKSAFSNECGRKTIISPISAFNGEGETIQRYEKDTVALVPVSMLDRLKIGECIVTQMRSDVLLSVMERSYMCPEFDGDTTNPADRGRRADFCIETYTFDEEDKDDDIQFDNDDLFDF